MPLPPPDVSDPFLGVHALSVVLWYSSQCVFPPPVARCSWVAVTVWGGERLGSVLETAEWLDRLVTFRVVAGVDEVGQ